MRLKFVFPESLNKSVHNLIDRLLYSSRRDSYVSIVFIFYLTMQRFVISQKSKMSYNLRSRGSLPSEGSPELDPEVDEELELYSASEESESDAIEDDPFYQPYLENEQIMNIGRILRMN